MSNERHGAVTIKGNALTVIGNPVSVGDKAPDFSLRDGGQAEVTLASSAGKIRLISVIPSLDTGICDAIMVDALPCLSSIISIRASLA